MATIGDLGRADVFDAGNRAPRRIPAGTDEDGLPITKKVPWGPYQFWCDANGHIRRLRLTNGAAVNDWDQDPYALKQIRDKRAAGWVYCEECPLSRSDARAFVPASMRKEESCDMAGKRPDERCKHMDAIVEVRRKAHLKRSQDAERSQMNAEKILREKWKAEQLADEKKGRGKS